MLLRIAIGLFVISNFLSCSKEDVTKPYGFLNLRAEGQEEDIKWETITGTWIDTLGNADIEATSYYYERCSIYLKNNKGAGTITPLSVTQFYYTDGMVFNRALFQAH